MKRTIFIPTDFSEASLGLVAHALLFAGDDEIEIVLTHCFFLNDSIVELLFFDKDELFQSVKSNQFNAAFEALCNAYSQVKVQFRWEIFTGFTLLDSHKFSVSDEVINFH